MTDGRSARFELLYRTHYRAVAGYVGRRLRADLVEDTVHEVFLVAWRRADVDRPGVGWLLAVARNVVAERYRAGSRVEAIRQAAVHQARTQMLTRGGAEDEVVERLAVFDALQSLSSDDQEVLMLTAWDDLDRSQAAAVLGCSPATYRMRLSRARKRFQDALVEIDRQARPVTEGGVRAIRPMRDRGTSPAPRNQGGRA